MKSKEELREYNRQWRYKNKDKTKAYYKKHYDNLSPEDKKRKSLRNRPNHLLSTYGITEDEYNIMLNRQNWLCAICRDPNAKSRYNRLCVDHCHITGNIRGLLCSGCNVAIAALGDNSIGLARALAYVNGDIKYRDGT